MIYLLVRHCSIAMALLGAFCAGGLPAQDPGALLAQTSFHPVDDQQRQQRQLAALQAADAASGWLNASPHGADWEAYLQLSELQSELSAMGDPGEQTSADAMKFTRSRLVGLHDGLELPVLVELREQLKHYATARDVYFHRDQVEAEFGEVLRELAGLLTADTTSISLDEHRRLEPLVAWLDMHDQAQALVDRLKQTRSLPNVRIDISRDAMLAMTQRDVYEVEPISENQDGRLITGQAVATGTAFLAPVSDLNAGRCNIIFQGNIRSTLNGAEGPVSFRLVGNTQLSVQRPVLFSVDRFQPLTAVPWSCTSLQTDRVCTRRDGPAARLVRKVAVRLIDKEQPDSRRDLDKETVTAFLQKFNEEIAEELAGAEADFKSDILAPMKRMDLLPDHFRFLSDDQWLSLVLKMDGGYGLTAPWLPVPNLAGADISLNVHETVVNRIADRMLADEEVADFRELVQQLGLSLSEEDLNTLPDDIGIQFAEQQPLTIRFEDDTLELTIRGDRFQVGRANLVAMNAVIRYRVFTEAGQMRLVLDGAPEVLPPEKGRSARFFAQRNILKRRLEQELPQQQTLEPFDLPSPATALGKAQFQSSNLEAGWLQIALRGDRSWAMSGK